MKRGHPDRPGFLSLQHGATLLDLRLAEIGGCRHPQQLQTPADCSCGVWAVAVQMSSCPFPEAVGAGVVVDRDYVDYVRCIVAMTLPRMVEVGELDWSGWEAPEDGEDVGVTPDGWVTKMCRNGEYVDEVWLQLAAKYLDRDLLLLPCFEKSSWDGTFRRIFGGRGVDAPASGPPIFLGQLEEEFFISPHYQVEFIKLYDFVFLLRHSRSPVQKVSTC